MLVTGSGFRFIVAGQLLAAGIDPGTVLIDPGPRDAAPVVRAAAAPG